MPKKKIAFICLYFRIIVKYTTNLGYDKLHNYSFLDNFPLLLCKIRYLTL